MYNKYGHIVPLLFALRRGPIDINTLGKGAAAKQDKAKLVDCFSCMQFIKWKSVIELQFFLPRPIGVGGKLKCVVDKAQDF